MPYNILNHAARAFHGGDFPLTRDLEDARRYRDAKRISEEKPYTKHLRDYIKDVCPDFEFTPFVNRLINIGEAIIVGDLQWAMIELPPDILNQQSLAVSCRVAISGATQTTPLG